LASSSGSDEEDAMTESQDNDRSSDHPARLAGDGAPSDGSRDGASYNDQGDLTGPDSPAGARAHGAEAGQGQGDDLADRLGGDRTFAGMSGAGAATGDMRADRSEPADADTPYAPSVGDPGGMGGPGVAGATGTGRPPGGVSPIDSDCGD
jgi:hypothetical protein